MDAADRQTATLFRLQLILDIRNPMPTRRIIKSVVNGLLGSFVSRNNDIDGYWGLGKLRSLSELYNTTSITINLKPKHGRIESQHISLNVTTQHYASMLVSIIERCGLPSAYIADARIIVDFVVPPTLPEPPKYTWGEPFLCTVVIIDDTGREWRASHTGRCGRHDPEREMRSTRTEFLTSGWRGTS